MPRAPAPATRRTAPPLMYPYQRPPMPAPPPHRLLIVDDDPSIHELIQAMFVGTRWQADSVSSGDEALARLEANSYDVVLADILMPGMDGLALLSQLRASHRDIPVVMMTVKN